MRISDWSSDVCSSDLGQRAAADMDVVRAAGIAPFGAVAHRACFGNEPVRAEVEPHRRPHADGIGAGRPADIAAVARQRSEERREGKSVSVRVDLGCRRLITKKKAYSI